MITKGEDALGKSITAENTYDFTPAVSLTRCKDVTFINSEGRVTSGTVLFEVPSVLAVTQTTFTVVTQE